MNTKKKVLIVGGGLVGPLCAIFLGKRGYQVTVLESRDDVRIKEDTETAINIILSERGRQALSEIGIEDIVLKISTPMNGRVLHYLSDKMLNILYDKNSSQCDYSINKNELNGLLLTEMEKYSNIDICFNHELTNINFDEGTITCLDLKTDITKTFCGDLIVGADGILSFVRRLMIRNKILSDFDRGLVEHVYFKFTVSKERGRSLTPNRYHIWPRGEYTMTALPNKDNSWNLTMFVPARGYEGMYYNEAKSKNFLKDTFPEGFALVGESLTSEYCSARPSGMLSLQYKPYHVGKKFLIIGDAAHPVVSYSNQGMNAGFEDCCILNAILSEKKDNIDSAVQEWTLRRSPAGYALYDLSMHAYEDIRQSPTKYFLRQLLDQLLFRLFPRLWIPTYVSLTFCNTSYEECRRHQTWQDKVIKRLCWFTVISVIVLMWAVYSFMFC